MKPTLRAAAVALLASAAAFGQDSATVASAREIAKDGLAAYDAGKYDEAADKLGCAYQLVKVPTLGLYTARALLQLGKLIEASEIYLETTRLEVTGSHAAAQEQAQKEAAQARSALLPRIPKLVVRIDGAEAGEVTVEVDGQAIPTALLGVGHLVNPGTREIKGRRGDQAVVEQAELGEGDRKTVVLRFGVEGPAAAPAAGGRAGAATKPAPTVGSSPPERGADEATEGNTQRLLGWIGVGVGGAGLVAGSITGLVAMGQRTSLQDEGCEGNACYTDQASDVDSYNSMRTASSVGFIVGGVGLAAGATLLLTAPSHAERAPTAGAGLWIGVGSAGVSGRF